MAAPAAQPAAQPAAELARRSFAELTTGDLRPRILVHGVDVHATVGLLISSAKSARFNLRFAPTATSRRVGF